MEAEIFDSDDVGLIEATVSKLYSKLSIGAVGDSTRAQITRRTLTPELSFDDLDYSFDIGYSGEAPGLMIICDVVSSTIRRVGEGHDETFGPGDLFLISRPGLPYAGLAHGSRLRFTVLDPAIFDRVVSNNDGGAGAVRELDHRPTSRAAARCLQQAIAYVRNSVMSSPEATLSPLVISSVTQYLAACVLQAFPNTAVIAMADENQRGANPSALRRAVSFIDANPDIDISLSDIAGAASVTPRALQLAFRRHLDTTPLAYLRQVRLDHAHEQLVQATVDDGITITRLAMDWGFANPSRFAQYYQAAYGETPSATLKR